MRTEDRYIYAVTRIHAHEKNLLGRRDIDALSAAESVQDALHLLSGKGWETHLGPAGMISREYEKTWALIAEAAGDIPSLNVFRRARDFHNLKAAIKLVYAAEPETGWDRYFQPYGTVGLSRIKKAAQAQNFSDLPEALSKAGQEAWEVLKATGSGQLCEAVIDRAALEEIYREGKNSGASLLEIYAELTVDAANVITAARCRKLGRDRAFLNHAIADAGRLPKEGLIRAALGEEPELRKLLRSHGYEKAAAALADSLTAFERWRGDELMGRIRPQRGAIFGVEPLAAFILGRENEIQMVRLILSAKINNLSGTAVRERLGLTYV